MNLAEEFAAWARDPHRTNDELYLAELLVEAGHAAWVRLTKAPWSHTDYDALFAHRKRRLLNPAYRAKLSRKKLDHTVEAWAEMDGVSNDRFNDRPVRDLLACDFSRTSRRSSSAPSWRTSRDWTCCGRSACSTCAMRGWST